MTTPDMSDPSTWPTSPTGSPEAMVLYATLRGLQEELHGLALTQARDEHDDDDAGPSVIDGELELETYADNRTRVAGAIDAEWASVPPAIAEEVRDMLDANTVPPIVFGDVPSVLPSS